VLTDQIGALLALTATELRVDSNRIRHALETTKH
jgi:hypothetical protein